ncbi:MAG: ATP synthase F1 subunit delta [Chitinophagaceae bacterium]
MTNPRVAGRYAKSLIDLAVERNELESVHTDIVYLRDLMKASREFTVVLRSPVIKADKKIAILNSVTKGNIGELTESFMRLMISKGREIGLPEIVFAFISQYNEIKGIDKVKLTTAQPLSEEVQQQILQKFADASPERKIDIETKVDEELIGGFVLEFNNNLVDASIARDLKDIKKQFQENSYIQNIR